MAAGEPPTELVDRAYSVGGHATDPAASMAALPDRRGLILALGIVQIVCGGLCLLATVGMVLALKAQPAAIFYAVATANLLATGIGSIRRARWARRATIISSAIWLVFVGIGVVASTYILVSQGGSGFGAGPLVLGLVTATVVAVFLLGLPITLLIVFTRPSVRATFERGQAP